MGHLLTGKTLHDRCQPVTAVLKRTNSAGDGAGHGFDRRRRHELGEAVRYGPQAFTVSPSPVAEQQDPREALDPLFLLMRIRDVEGVQRELTLQLSHVTSTFSSSVQGMQADISRLIKLLERRDNDSKAIVKDVTTFRGVLIGFGLVGSLLLGLAVAYFQLQVNSVYSRIDRNETSIRELQHK